MDKVAADHNAKGTLNPMGLGNSKEEKERARLSSTLFGSLTLQPTPSIMKRSQADMR